MALRCAFLIFSLIGFQSFAFASGAPKQLVTENYGCGNEECCNFEYEWPLTKAAVLREKPGAGKKAGTLSAGAKVKVVDSKNIATRGLLKLSKDKAGVKAGAEIYFFNKDPSEGLILFSKSGEEIKSPSGTDFISVDMLKPGCREDLCVGEIVTPSKGHTYLKVKSKEGLQGWVDYASVDVGC